MAFDVLGDLPGDLEAQVMWHRQLGVVDQALGDPVLVLVLPGWRVDVVGPRW